MKHIDFRKKNNKQSYLRYNDVFMSRGNPANNRNYSDEVQRSEMRDSPPPNRVYNNRLNQDETEYQRDDRYIDRYDDGYDDEIYDHKEEVYDQRSISPYDREYFSGESGILNERMVKYQKRQLPPLHRYGSNSRNNYPAPRMMYWDEDEDQGGYSRHSKRYSQFGAIWQRFIVTFASILSLVCITWIAYNWNGGHRQTRNSDGPVIIEPEHASFKVLPDQPGGIEIEHKDKTVYERLHPGSSGEINIEERLLPPQEDPIDIPSRQAAPQAAPQSSVEEYSIVDDKTYYIKLSAGKNKHILENEAKLMKKKYGQLIGDIKCEVKKVSNAQGEQKHAILIGPFDSQDAALDLAKHLGGQCYIVSVKE
ncbi:MAG: SPOR domain-containing protein [Holosporales bacterium]|jgi:hypothetical protein|nr:SPOR domain-containing protein [Holosporales bacterium]